MDLSATYCQTRRDLEEHGWALSSRLATVTSRLLQLIGSNHAAFLATVDECHAIHLEIAESHKDLKRHRRDHGC